VLKCRAIERRRSKHCFLEKGNKGKMDIEQFLGSFGLNEQGNQWDNVIVPESVYLVMGDRRMGKSALCYWLLERYSDKYDLLPVVVGLPRDRQSLLPDKFIIKDSTEDCIGLENAIVLIDEAGLQLPIEDTKAREYVVNFLSLPGHRNQVLLLTFHFPKLVLARYLPFFDGFLLKRPPYLIEFSGKRQNDALTQMMLKAEERFSELPSEQLTAHTYVVCPRLRWQGMLQNPLPSFWQDALSKGWSGVRLDKQEPTQLPLEHRGQRKGYKLGPDGEPILDEKRQYFWVTPEMERRKVEVERGEYTNSSYIKWFDPVERIYWIDFRRNG